MSSVESPAMGVRGARRRCVALLIACALVAAGCGNRLSRDEILAQNTISDGAATGPSRAAGTGAASSGSQVAAASGAPSGPAVGADPAATDPAAGGGAGAQPAGGGTGGQAAAAGSGTPIVIGMVGWFSGIGGQTSGYSREALVAWQRTVNDRGGINGHPVELLVGDDGGNESRSLSIVRDFVENQGAVAIVNYQGGSGVAVSQYAASQNIPVVGGLPIEQLWTENPMMFPTAGATEGHFWGSARLARDAGVTKVATVYCTEVAACQGANDSFVRQAREAGLEVVYQGRISFTQPDYTAECLQMRNAGAQAIIPITENSSTVRLAQSCGRQDYAPTFVLSVANDDMPDVPEFEGAIASLIHLPWFLRSGSPALEEYGQAVERYLPERVDNGVDILASGWTAGKLFEQAAQGVSDNPTSAEILEGLWAMQGETLGGLLQGPAARTYTRGQPTPETYCVYEARIQGGEWTAPRGATPVCR